jgi:type III secretory pathway component EscU
MVKSAQKFDLLKELGISEYAHIVTLALLLLIVPITCGLCICTLKDSSIFQKCKDSRAIKLARDVPTRVRNAQNNFRFVKNRIFSEN